MRIQILLFLFLFLASCIQTAEQKREVELSPVIQKMLDTIKLEAKDNPKFCSKLPTKYNNLEKDFVKNEGNEFFKLQAGVVAGFYRHAALNNKCDVKFLEKNVSLLSSIQGKDYSGAGVFYFLGGELIGFQSAALMKYEPGLTYHGAFLLAAINLVAESKKMGASK